MREETTKVTFSPWLERPAKWNAACADAGTISSAASARTRQRDRTDTRALLPEPTLPQQAGCFPAPGELEELERFPREARRHVTRRQAAVEAARTAVGIGARRARVLAEERGVLPRTRPVAHDQPVLLRGLGEHASDRREVELRQVEPGVEPQVRALEHACRRVRRGAVGLLRRPREPDRARRRDVD